MEKTYRYPGVRPFTKEESNIFFGREQDARKLFDLLVLEKIVVLFSKSGRGKSSLINAALIPIFNNTVDVKYNYTPVEIRLNEVKGDTISPVDKIIAKLNEIAPVPNHQHPVLDRYNYQFKLWHHFKKIQLTQPRKFLLIFDQFEEFFNTPIDEQNSFKRELSELLYTTLPPVIREDIDNLSHEEYDILSQNMDVHVLFSIRSDRLSNMHSLTDVLPNLLINRFEIQGLSVMQAKEAIQNPAAIDSSEFVSHAFSYDAEALQEILTQFSSATNNEISIEPFHLQIICQACETKIVEKLKHGEVDIEINKSDLPSFDNLYGDYYKRQIKTLPEDLREKAQQFLEKNLIHEIGNSNEYRRIPVDKDVLLTELQKISAPDEMLGMLEQAFLLRREQNSVGGYSYELAHDTILEPIVNIKRQRQAIEKEKQIAQLLLAKKSIVKERIWGRITLGIFAMTIIALLSYFNWEAIFFTCKTAISRDERPIVRKPEKLETIINQLKDVVMAGAIRIDYNNKISTWEASQLIIALYGDKEFDISGNIKKQYLNQAQKTLIKNSCCWREVSNIDDIRASSWIISANGMLGLTNRFACSTLKFLLSTQSENGGWPMVVFSNGAQQYNSTYATCHVLRALHNSLHDVKDSVLKKQILSSIGRGKAWLHKTIADASRSIWTDYEQDENYDNLISKSLSGLALHTLNILDTATSWLNRNWLRNLKKSDALVDINLREKSGKNYKTTNGSLAFIDSTRHLVIPWQMIATIDAYKNGNFNEKIKANKWLDAVIENLNINDMIKTPRFAKAEILIALKYLQNEDYPFK